MSRSRRKPYCTYCGGSNKKSKRIANRRFRKRSKEALMHGKDLPKCMNEVSNPWTWPTDGLAHYAKYGGIYRRCHTKEEWENEFLEKIKRK